jgi:uncharacterized protein (DUF4415 family)
MGMVQSVIDTENHHLSEETVAELTRLKDRPIDYSDIPAMTHEEMQRGKLMAIKKKKKQMFSLRLQTSTIKWWKQHVGYGYTGVLSGLLEEATKHPEWIKDCF